MGPNMLIIVAAAVVVESIWYIASATDIAPAVFGATGKASCPARVCCLYARRGSIQMKIQLRCAESLTDARAKEEADRVSPQL